MCDLLVDTSREMLNDFYVSIIGALQVTIEKCIQQYQGNVEHF